jgi:nucleoside-diphosphate-sugar epimerase
VGPQTDADRRDFRPLPDGQHAGYRRDGAELRRRRATSLAATCLAYERGRSGERYILGGENLDAADAVGARGRVAGRRPPRFTVPGWLPLGVAWVERNYSRSGWGSSPKLSVDGVRMSRESMYYDASKAKAQLGSPRADRCGHREAIEWFARNGYLGSHGGAARNGAPR